MSPIGNSVVFFLAIAATLMSPATAQNDNNHTSTSRREYCSRGNLCLISFDWCQYTPRTTPNGTFNTGICDYRNLVDSGFMFSPVATFDIALFSTRTYNLSWINADPDYDTRVEWYTGPPEGVVNNTVPLYNFSTRSTYFLVRPLYLTWEVRGNVPQDTTNYYGYAEGWNNYFVISQPDRPAQAGINTTDQSNNFKFASQGAEYYVRDLRASYNDAQAKQNQKWKTGVGIGVGLGVPLLMLLTFVLGRRSGKKVAAAGTKKALSTAPAGKESVDLSDGDRPGPGAGATTAV